MTQTEILNECKQQITDEYGYVRWEGVVENKVEAAISELAILFAQRMAEKFAEWTRVNAEPYIYNKEVWTVSDSDGYITHDEITTSQLYELFLTTLNKDL